VSSQIVSLKSIAAYRSGLEINPNVSKTDAEDGLRKELTGKTLFLVMEINHLKKGSHKFCNYIPPCFSGPRPFRITNKNLIDYIFTCSLEIAVSVNLPVQIHTG
jgi:hypothetical protein